MALQIGIVGLPNVGKSTLFNALCRKRSAQAQNYAFCTIDPNVGVVEVPDERLQKIAEIAKPEKIIPTSIEFVDIAGLVKGASEGEGLGNQFLSHIREVDAIAHVVRDFADSDVMHVDGNVDANRDEETIKMELILADLQSLDKKFGKDEGKAKVGDKDAKARMDLIALLKENLSNGKLASEVEMNEDQKILVKELFLLTVKPIISVMNTDEESMKEDSKGIIKICAKMEDDLIDLSKEEASEYMSEFGVKSSGLDKLIKAAYEALGLQTFLTAGPKECRAWTVRKGAKAPEAAGCIHTDFEKGFICAEVIDYDDFVECGGEAGAKEKGKMRKEGKEYVMKDGDVVLFRFNV
ncbi:redox-regulated ATPase YchF [Candidatus Peribacteria bacterium]|jgi:ribosome-binding ATPase|nr:redox-regulated ATPase YchF [Candidatus Peribacteria bacterium]MBT4021242.1 redox-regulated ATPase YchF [Candidatus Peribacteria bacterium]MBT4240523.1 redox-regulated ATPase YchF [Candidatus Peribacteria bacterium]MBT4473971.1 redox-regulated ATPase YchF [Candidatus Peribacteria bacterium]